MLDGKRAYICSPLSATTKEVRQQNMEKAKFYLMQIKRLYRLIAMATPEAAFPKKVVRFSA